MGSLQDISSASESKDRGFEYCLSIERMFGEKGSIRSLIAGLFTLERFVLSESTSEFIFEIFHKIH